jgi:hypothetical protein
MSGAAALDALCIDVFPRAPALVRLQINGDKAQLLTWVRQCVVRP